MVNAMRSFLILLTALWVPAVGTAGQDVDEASSSPQNIFPDADEIGGNRILQARDDYLDKRGWSLGFSEGNPSGAYIGWGEASIQVSPESVSYGKARIAAVDSAILGAIGEFTLSLGRETVTETVREVFQDPGALERARDANMLQYYRAIEDRVKNVTVAQLDQLLESLGADPSEHADLDFSRKVDLARESVTKRIIRTAAEQFNGIRVLSTFEEENQIGALVIYHPRLQRLAQDIVNGNFVAIGEGFSEDAIQSAIGDMESRDYLFIHGLRVLKDDDGNRVLLSFGQASPAVTRADSQMKQRMAVNAAERESDLRSDAYISEFLNSFVEVEEKQLSEAAARITAEVTGSSAREFESTSFADSLTSLMRQTSESDMTGIVTVHNWRANHPDTGHLYVGSIKAWSPKTNSAFTKRLQQRLEPGPDPSREVDVEVRRSRDVGDEDW
jgi:hypothetical protein